MRYTRHSGAREARTRNLVVVLHAFNYIEIPGLVLRTIPE